MIYRKQRKFGENVVFGLSYLFIQKKNYFVSNFLKSNKDKINCNKIL